jgi:hypothetical protein
MSPSRAGCIIENDRGWILRLSRGQRLRMAAILTTALRRARKVWTDPHYALEAIEYTYVDGLHWWLRKKLMPIFAPRARHKLERLSVVESLDAYNARRPPSSFAPDWGDLLHLYNDVRRLKPKILLEYGSGQSTVVLARAIADNGTGHLTTLEADRGWADINRAAIPTNLRPFVTIIHSDFHVISQHEVRYSHSPVLSPDFVYLDGPAFPCQTIQMAALDLVDLEPKFPPSFRLVIDGRTYNKNQLLRRFKRRYHSRRRGLVSNDTIVTLYE